MVLDAHKPLDEMKRVSMPSPRRLPPPLALDEMNNACFIVRDKNGQALGYSRTSQETARKRSRYGHRDATMILIAYRHGLRASELCGLRWDQIELNSGRLHVRRAKGGIDNVHPLSGREIRALRQLRRENMESRYVFITERGGPATTAGFLKTIARIGEAAKLPFPIHPHMLRHSTGYKLANDGHDTRALQHYMGHKNIMHTVRYTDMAPDRFKNFWQD